MNKTHLALLTGLLAAVLLTTGCPGPQQPTPEPDRPPAGAQTSPGMSGDITGTLTQSHDRLAARLARYRQERPDTPDLDKAELLLKEAAAGLKELETITDQEKLPLAMHAINTKFYHTEQIIPPLDD
jgi:hypothetical protein